MYRIVEKKTLNPSVVQMTVEAPLVARHARAGQFVILRPLVSSERIPLTIAGAEGSRVTIIYQIAGSATEELNHKEAGDYIYDFVGPLGVPTHLEGLKKVAVVGGGVGCAIAWPIVKALHQQGAEVDAVIGFRNKDLVILEAEFRAVSNLSLMTDDGSYGEKGFVTDALRTLLESGKQYDKVFAIGPLRMMQAVCKVTKEFEVPTVVSMNPIMVDGTGMCGGCRLTVGGQTKFACVDGPDFDGHLVDFDEAISRTGMYKNLEIKQREDTCRLYKKEK